MIVGIDLGTTNSAVGIWRDGKTELIPNSLGAVLTPSINYAKGLQDRSNTLSIGFLGLMVMMLTGLRLFGALRIEWHAREEAMLET